MSYHLRCVSECLGRGGGVIVLDVLINHSSSPILQIQAELPLVYKIDAVIREKKIVSTSSRISSQTATELNRRILRKAIARITYLIDHPKEVPPASA